MAALGWASPLLPLSPPSCCLPSSRVPSRFSSSSPSRLTRTPSRTIRAAPSSRTASSNPIQRAELYFSTDTRPIILFDGVCNLCNGGVNFVLDNDLNGKLRFAALQSEAGRALLQRSGRSPDDISSIVLVEKNRSYIKSEAVLRIAEYLGFPFPVVAAMLNPVPLFLRNLVYDTVATNRYLVFGQTNTCRLSDPRSAERFLEV